MTTCIALLRGINVGRAKRIAMGDLRGLAEDLGWQNPRTLRNSGNLVFDVARPSATKLAGALEAAIEAHAGFTSKVIVVTASELKRVIEANPLADSIEDPSRFLVAFAASAKDLTSATALLDETWDADAFAMGKKCAYLSCPNGILKSQLLKEFERVTKKAATSRNWKTVLKLQEMAC